MTRLKISPLMQSALAGLVVFATVLVCVNYLSVQAKKINRQNLDHQLLTIAEHAAAFIDGDKHEVLLAAGKTDSALYKEMIAPLVKIHNVTPDLHYLYTMKDTGTHMVFGLDTSTDPKLKSQLDLEPSFVGDIWEVDEVQYLNWSEKVKTDGAHVDAEFSSDDFGTFVTACAPFYNSDGDYVGFVGVDVGTTYFNAYQKRINDAVVVAAILNLILSVIIAYFFRRKQRDIQNLQNQLYRDAVTDPLTQCFNRRHFNNEYDKACKTFKESGADFCLALFDIDHFKTVNDTRGHIAGDQILKQFSKALKTCEGVNVKLFRIGGEEFALLINLPDQKKIDAILNHSHDAIKNHHFIVNDDQRLDITASIGVAQARISMDVFKAADDFLYVAKKRGRNQIARDIGSVNPRS